jgi:hypothetical protein
MASSLHILGIRHHGPGSARMVVRALAAIKFDDIVVDGSRALFRQTVRSRATYMIHGGSR